MVVLDTLTTVVLRLEAPCTLNLRTKASSKLENIWRYSLKETAAHLYKLLLQKSQQRQTIAATSFHLVFRYIAFQPVVGKELQRGNYMEIYYEILATPYFPWKRNFKKYTEVVCTSIYSYTEVLVSLREMMYNS